LKVISSDLHNVCVMYCDGSMLCINKICLCCTEIRAVKRRKEKAKELEGIDTTNIISEPRGRRAASNFFLPPPQYKVSDEDEEDSDDEDDSKSSEDDGMHLILIRM
jgi:hypothetical protein